MDACLSVGIVQVFELRVGSLRMVTGDGIRWNWKEFFRSLFQVR